MSDNHYPGCGKWSAEHAACATTDQLIEAMEELCDEFYSDGVSDGHPLHGYSQLQEKDRLHRRGLYLSEIRRRLEGKGEGT